MSLVREKLVLPNHGKKLLLHSCCAYLLRESNKWRVETGRERIKLGTKYYGINENKK